MSSEQMQQMLNLLQEQCTTMKQLQEENQELRDATRNGGGSAQFTLKKPDRPVVDRDIDDREWAIFEDAWSRYKQLCNLKDTDVGRIRLELRESCSSDVNKLLFEYVGATTLNECSEKDLLDHIKSVAVKSVHKEVHRAEFHTMTQDLGEPVTRWTARLKAKAFHCQFEVPCKCCTPAVMTSFAEEEIAQRLVTGLRSQEHKRKVLAEAATLTTLELKVARLQILESTEESVSSLNVPGEAAAGKSQYQAAKSLGKVTTSPGLAPTCQWCGHASHRGGDISDRKNCPAKDKKCNKCKLKGHFGAVCKKSAEANSAADEEEEEVQPIAADASVSFVFGASSGSVETSVKDFRRGRRSDGKP